MGRLIGADWLIYQDLEDLVASASEGNLSIKQFECSVFNGEYITGDIDQAYLERIDAQRNDAAKLGDDSSADTKQSQGIGIHNNGANVV